MEVKKHQRFSKEQQIALLQECMASGLSGREYAALKQVGYSTLTRWASQLGVPLTQTSLPRTGSISSKAAPQNNHQERFSFIDLTGQGNEAPPNFEASLLPGPSVQESPSPCGLEIQMPNGVMLKFDRVPFGALWPRVVEFVRALA